MRIRQERLLNGEVNCMPFFFKSLIGDYPGLEQSQYVAITSYTKGAKSQFTSFVYIFQTIMFSYFTKATVDFKIIYFPLEETKERITQRFISWLLFRFSKKKMRYSPSELRSTTSPLPDEVFERIEQCDIQNILDYFEEHVIFPTEAPNPTGIYKFCKQYAEEHGTVYTKRITIKDEFGVPQEKDAFDHYEQDNPNEYRMIIIDTINLIDTERGMNLKESMDKLSEYCAKYLRNRYHYSPIIIQQQAFSGEGLDAFKLNRVRPSVGGLGDSKYISRDANIVFGLFSPERFGITEYGGYDITKIKDHIRFLEVLVNRDGAMGGITPIFFDGAVCDFEQLPNLADTNSPTYNQDKKFVEGVYKYVKTLDKPKPAPQLQPQQQPKAVPALFLGIKERLYNIIDNL